MAPHSLKFAQTGLIHSAVDRATAAAVAFLLLTIGLLSNASGAGIVSDDFEGARGAPQSREPTIDNTGIPDNRWVWASGHTYLENGFVISAVTGSSMGGRIRIPAPSGGIDVSCIAQLNTGIEGDSPYTPVDWIAVGLLASPEAGWIAPEGGNLLWVLVRPNGGWTLFEDGTSRILAASTPATRLPAFEQGFFNTVITLRYDCSSSRAALLVDGKNVSGWHATALDASRISVAGFQVRALPASDPRVAKIDAFSVTSLSAGDMAD